MMRFAVGLALLIFGSTGGEIAITYGMKSSGSQSVSARKRCYSFWCAHYAMDGSGWVRHMMALAFYALLVLLSWEPISLVIPASALSYVVGTFGAKYVLGEECKRGALGRSNFGLHRRGAGRQGVKGGCA